jgi:hypothetical protein
MEHRTVIRTEVRTVAPGASNHAARDVGSRLLSAARLAYGLGAILILAVTAMPPARAQTAQGNEAELQIVSSAQSFLITGIGNTYQANFGVLDGLGLHKPLGITVTQVRGGVIYWTRLTLLTKFSGTERAATVAVHARYKQRMRPGMILEGDSVENLTPVPLALPGKVIHPAARAGTMFSRVIGIFVSEDSDDLGPVSAQLVFTITGQ